MVKEGVLQNPRPQAIFGLHAFSEMAVGDIGYSEGPALSAADTWEVKITGRQSHGARPELSIDPIVTAAQFVQALQTIRSRTFSGHEPGVVTIGSIHGGQRHNIIPGRSDDDRHHPDVQAGDEHARGSAAPRHPQRRDRSRRRDRRSRALRARRAGDDQQRRS